jgi:peptide-methionine (R)-S-oxide reductase
MKTRMSRLVVLVGLVSALGGALALSSGCDRSASTTLAQAPTTAASTSDTSSRGVSPTTSPSDPIGKLELSDAEWKKRLTPEQYHILREHGTEQAFTGPYWDWHGEKGTFVCAGCDLPLFEAKTKFDSGTGWPSFYDCVPGHVVVSKDTSFGMVRDELSCARCGGHLGHVFDDGPQPTGKRYCIDGYALKLTGEK